MSYESHYVALASLVARTNGPVLELGVGEGSTPLLHYLCRGRRLVSADNGREWLRRFGGYDIPGQHEFVYVEDWDKLDGIIEREVRWSVALVDFAPGEKRISAAMQLKDVCDYIICHDSETDFGAAGNYQYHTIVPSFKYVSEYKRFRPYTLILSNVGPFEVSNCDLKWSPSNTPGGSE